MSPFSIAVVFFLCILYFIMEDCIFCKIIEGGIPSEKVYEDTEVYAFLDINPLNPGHTLVIPKKHARNSLEMSADDFSDLTKKVHKVAHAVKKATSADGINIVFNNEAAAGQEVFHTHAHVTPRFKDDGHKWWAQGSYEPGEAEVVAEKIKLEL